MTLTAALIVQTDPNWLAFVFKTDPAPFDERMHEIISHFADSRLIHLPLPPSVLPNFTALHAGYQATDFVLRLVLRERPECRWVSATNGDNVYGSDVVSRILTTPAVDPADGRVAQMLLAPIDSRNFAEQGKYAIYL